MLEKLLKENELLIQLDKIGNQACLTVYKKGEKDAVESFFTNNKSEVWIG